MTPSGKAGPTTLSDTTRATIEAFAAQAGPAAARGTARTMLVVGSEAAAAQVAATVAGHLKRELLRVPLSTVVSPDIGETGKHLDRVFAAASKSGAVLFFDEADALFGKRGDVKDSHDRYANAAADGLLQRIESHAGIAILATRKKQDLDGAFMRRLAPVAHVDPPD